MIKMTALLLLATLSLFARKQDVTQEILMSQFPSKEFSVTKLSYDNDSLLYIQTFWSCKEERVVIIPKKKTLSIVQEQCGSDKYKISGASLSDDSLTTTIYITTKAKVQDSITLIKDETDRKQTFYTLSSDLFTTANGLFINTADTTNYESFCPDCSDQTTIDKNDEINGYYEDLQ